MVAPASAETAARRPVVLMKSRREVSRLEDSFISNIFQTEQGRCQFKKSARNQRAGPIHEASNAGAGGLVPGSCGLLPPYPPGTSRPWHELALISGAKLGSWRPALSNGHA